MQFSHSFSWWMAVLGLATAAVIITFAYYRTNKPLSRRWRTLLIALRIASVGLLLICLLEPTLVARDETLRKANLLVLVDDSQSMSLADVGRAAGDRIARVDAVKEATTPSENSPMAALADRFNVQLYQFSSDCIQVEELAPTAEGTLTDIGTAISKAASEWRGQFTAGIVLVTDGAKNFGENPLDVVRQLDMPVYAVGVGSTEMPRDIQVARVEVSPVAYVDHLLPIRAVIKSSGYAGREVQVTLAQDDGVLRDSVAVTLSDLKDGEQTVDLQVKPQQEGTFNFSVAVPVAPDELTTQNNTHPFFVKVVKKKLEVLCVDGRPRWEYTFLKRAFRRDPNMEPTYLVIAGDEAAPLSFPDSRKELFSYDVVILGDVSPRHFSSEQLNMIGDFVEDQGGSVILLGGKHSLGRDGFGGSILRGMLPIEIGPGGGRRVQGAFNPVLTQDGLRHPITRFSDDPAENVAIWRDLPALNQLYAGEGIKLGATVLAVHQRAVPDPRGHPVIVFQRYGNGIVLMITSDSTWRWAFGAYPFGGDDSHYRGFWSRTIRWLASVHTEANLVNVEADKQSYYRDEKVRVTAHVYDESYAPVSDAKLKAQVQLPGPSLEEGRQGAFSSSELEFTSDGSGRYSAEFTPVKDGRHKIQVEAYHGGRLLGRNSTEVVVQTAGLEFRDAQLKEAFLKSLADISGGSYHHLRDISDLPSSIRDVSETYSFIRERGIWDNAIVLMLAVALLSAEWVLRKRKGLV